MSASIARAAGGRPHLIADAIPLLDVSAYLAGRRATLERSGPSFDGPSRTSASITSAGTASRPSLIDATLRAAARFHALPDGEEARPRGERQHRLPADEGRPVGGPPSSRNDAFFLRRERAPTIR